MPEIELEHFLRAAADIGAHGDNDTLPFDVETRFLSDKKTELSAIAFDFFQQLQGDSIANSKNRLGALTIFSERLLTPTGPAGFRTSTKIQAFWNLYFNGLCVAIASALEGMRHESAHSYRFLYDGGDELFDRDRSWRAFRQKTAEEALSLPEKTVVVQTDISGFYDHISHHHIENFVDDVFTNNERISKQIGALLAKFSSGRSFGLPVGGQGSRILAELFMNQIDRQMTAMGVTWHRYVDDYVLIANSNESAYRALSVLSHTLADYGLSLSKSKTIFLSAKHYSDYVATQLGLDDAEAGKLREIDLHFDPYSDAADDEYESLKETVEALEIQKLLNRELEKGLPDTFLVTQIGRTLRLHEPLVALQLATTLLSAGNLHAFRASWSTIMRGVSNLRSNDAFTEIFAGVDNLLDSIPNHSSHLLQAEANLLHYLRSLRFMRTEARSIFISRTYESTRSESIKRACIDCWRAWRDRGAFTALRNRWNEMNVECQRLLWLMSFQMGDQGDGFRRQTRQNIRHSWRLGIERQGAPNYASVYEGWCDEAHTAI